MALRSVFVPLCLSPERARVVCRDELLRVSGIINIPIRPVC